MPFKRFDSYYVNLKSMAEFVLDVARTLPFTPKELYQIELAVDEACANVIDHAYLGEGKGSILIRVETSENALRIQLEDQGIQFCPDEVPEPDLVSPLEARKERGLGVYTIRKVMDQVIYDCLDDGVNRLTMVKQFRSI
ncbi:MAG: ATP-binding protein [Anaerolineaceae bacterium]|jgi:serine/threonine-protein kinase RsbW